MKRGAAAVVAIALAGALTGCGSSGGKSAPGSKSTRTTPARSSSAATASTSSSEANTTPASPALAALYLREMRKILPSNGQTDHQLTLFAKGTCEYFDAGNSYLQVLKQIIGTGLSGYKAGEAITYSVLVYCPKYKADLPS